MPLLALLPGAVQERVVEVWPTDDAARFTIADGGT